MDTIFMNSENSKTSEPHILKVKLTDKLDSRLDKKVIALSNLSIYYTWDNIKSSYNNNNNRFKISTQTWHKEFTVPDGSYKISDIQDYFQYILKKHGEKIDNDNDDNDKNKPSVKIYFNKAENRIKFKIKNRYAFELLTKETMKLLASTENKITKDENGENVPHLEVTEVVLVHCNMVNNDYQQDSRVLYTFIPNKSFVSLIDISPSNPIFFKTFNSEYDEVIVWLTDQNSNPLEIENRINLTMIIK